MFFLRIAPFVLVLALVGCATTPPVYEFRVDVKNATNDPLTIGLTKTGPPIEKHWAAPENYAMMPQLHQPERWGQVVAPGKTLHMIAGGHFAGGTYAMLRAYAGDRAMADLLAISHNSPDRTDVMLNPGENHVTLEFNERGKLISKSQ